MQKTTAAVLVCSLLISACSTASKDDKALMGVGMILFWPALFALGGTKAHEAEYARIKGEHDAIQQAAIAKKCPALISPALPAPLEAPAYATPPANS